MNKSEKTRLQLKKAAIKLFYEKGFEETTFKQIAEAAGVTQPLLYSYVKNKMDLLYECCVYAAEIGRQQIYVNLEIKKSATSKLQQYLTGNLKWFESDPMHAHMILSMYYFAGSNKKIRGIFDLSQEMAVEKIYEILELGKNREWNGIRLNEKSMMIHSLLVGEVYKQFFPLSKVPAEERGSRLAKVCLKILKD